MKCKTCGSTHVVKNGRHYRSLDGVPYHQLRYLCMDCGKQQMGEREKGDLTNKP